MSFFEDFGGGEPTIELKEKGCTMDDHCSCRRGMYFVDLTKKKNLFKATKTSYIFEWKQIGKRARKKIATKIRGY